ncbi:transcriptional regulator, DeoR family [Pilibacter termitis]|uniref:Transcriptional regulator, DeoR family n=1 Tax=Pilibacter termitis TaxID=263852 RepID=A0A1T4LNV1_9ENTE|nr:DeoR/GlpR family DNA-binding transcription regulator [Pilibacter termitis]SJZ56419.1 transcriptional regulator, DeoR family [Pilibacter termitis]
MLIEERKKIILEQLEREEIVKTSDLIVVLNSSESSVRRDLALLEEEGLLRRIHGGAKKITPLNYESNMEEKSSKNVQKKKDIANFALSFLKENDVVFIDAGSTTHFLVKKIAETLPKIQVVTNSIHHAVILAEVGIPVTILGGQVKLTTDAVVGATASQQISQYQLNVSFLGINGIDEKFGYTTPDPEEASIKQQIIQQSQKTYVLADETKFENVAFVRVAKLEAAEILTDRISNEMKEKIEKETKVYTLLN